MATTSSAAAPRATLWSGRRVIGDYISMTKPRIVLLVLITTFGAMWMAAEGAPPLGLIAATLIAEALAVGGSHAFNMVVDRDIDAIMARTSERPLPKGRVSPASGIIFSLVQSVLGVAVMAIFVNPLSGLLNALGILSYTVLYTLLLKRTTVHNTVLGGIAGAIPPVIGWAAVTNTIALPAILLFGILFFWQPPHFWALALYRRAEYAAAKLPMLPVVRGADATRRQMLVCAWLLLIDSLLLYPLGYAGWLYEIAAAVLGVWFVASITSDMRKGTDAAYRHLFKVSVIYLGVLFFALAIDFAVRSLLA